MERLFVTHRLRKSREADPLWRMTTLDEGGLPAPVKVLVPGIWESLPALKNYRGRAVYEQTVTCGGNVRFRLGGVSFRAKVWLDDALLTEHYGAYTAFDALATQVPRGQHTLRVEADNRFGADSSLHFPNDYYAYGGINRPVIIEECGDAYIERLHVTPCRNGDGWRAKAEVRIRNLTDAPIRCMLRLTAAGSVAELPVTLRAGDVTVCAAELDCAHAEAWSPMHPVTQEAEAVLVMDGRPMDDLVERFGFREVRVEGKHIRLNGKPLRLMGFNRHEDYCDFGLSVPLEAMARDIQLMLDMGANCVRTSHYPNDPRFLDLCDEMGLMVWEEAHARGLTEEAMRHPLFKRQTEACIREMIDQHYNHPSIFIWGCLNECADDCEYGAACYSEAYRLLDELDATRPMTAALLERPGGLVYADSDVVSVNVYPKWYYNGTVSASLANKQAEISACGGQDKPLIVSEVGAGAIYGYHDPLGGVKWSEERQCAILREQIEEVLAYPDCTGVFLWQFADVRVDEGWAMSRPRCMNNKGVVDEYRRPKMAYAVVKELFHRFAP